jgi:hypothetical protein
VAQIKMLQYIPSIGWTSAPTYFTEATFRKERQEGRKDRRKGGRKEGRERRKTEGRTNGRPEERKDGREEG